jgi:hypothetical protein
MKKLSFKSSFLLFILVLFYTTASIAETSRTKVILMEPIIVNNEMIAEPGQMVYCIDTNTTNQSVTLEIDGGKYPNINEKQIIPYNPFSSASSVYHYLVEGRSTNLEKSYYLSKNICTLFPDHPLYQDLYWLYYRYATAYVASTTDDCKIVPNDMTIIDTYLTKFPNGKYYDAFQWEKIKLDNYVYEYEGYAGEAVKQIKAYEDYLKQHPQSKVRDDIMLTIAHICRIAQECIENPPEDKDIDEGFKPEDAVYYRDKAINYYKMLMESTDIMTREKARVAIFSIKNHRRIYYEDNDWLQYKYD